MTDPFEVLPPEVYLHIASFLEVHNVPALACVSRQWHGLLEQDTFWKGLYVRRFVLRQGTHLPQPFARKAAWPAARQSRGNDGDDHDGIDSPEKSPRLFSASPASQRHRAQAQAQALLEADAVEREAEERRLAEEEMHRLRHDLPIDAPHAWKTCYRRRLRMKEGTCLVFMVGSNSLPYAADVVDKLYAHGVKVNSTCIIQQSYDEAGPPKGWEEDMLYHLHHHSVVIFFSNIAGGSDAVRNQIGNHLADFVESGGSVVLLAFATCNLSESPGGRWLDNNYFPILTAGQTSIRVELDRHSEGIDHHLLHGVRHAFVSYHGVGLAHKKAKVIGQWSDKTPAMARLKAQRGTIIAVNFFPPSMDIGDGGWPAQGSARWTAREDNSSARAWMYQLMDQLARTSTTTEAERDDEAAPVASVSPTSDGDVTPIQVDDPAPTLSGGSAELIAGMEIPPELTALLREVGEMSANSGDDPWERLLTRIDSDENAEADTGADTGAGDDNDNTNERMEVAAVEVASGTPRVEQKRSADEVELFANDALVMLTNAVKYALRKASRLEPRKGFSHPSPEQQRSRGPAQAGSKKPSCLLG